MNCPHCNKLLVPYVYDESDAVIFKLQAQGMLIWGGEEYQVGYPTYFCKKCEEHHYFIDAQIQKISSKKSYSKKQKRGLAA